MDKLSVQERSPKEKAAAYRSSKSKTGKKSKGVLSDEQQEEQQMKVVYISNPMRVTINASEFKDRVQELTGRDADVADIFFNSSSDCNGSSGAGTAASPPNTTAEYNSPCSSSSRDDSAVPPATAGGSMMEPAGHPLGARRHAELMGHHQIDWRRGGVGGTSHEDDAAMLGTFTGDGGDDAYHSDTFGSHVLGNHPFAQAAAGLQPPAAAGRFESPLADVFRRLADGRP